MEITIPSVVALISAIGVGAQLFIAERGRRQLASQTRETMAMQQLVSHRSTAAFIADKRQKWIDELRTDMAYYLAQSQEMAWKWDAVRSSTAFKVQQLALNDPIKKNQIEQEVADNFSKINGELDRSHQERHLRIQFRLNPEEDLHIKLRVAMDEVRSVLSKTQSTRSQSESQELLSRMQQLVGNSAKLTEQVLKSEWQRVKQEVAYPDSLMASIPQPAQT